MKGSWHLSDWRGPNVSKLAPICKFILAKTSNSPKKHQWVMFSALIVPAAGIPDRSAQNEQ